VTEIQTLVAVQEQDTRIAGLEADMARLPREIEALQAALADGARLATKQLWR